MIAKLSGILDSVSLDALIVDVGGVGYEVFASHRTRSRIGQAGDTVSVLIDTHVREDAITLFGFVDAAEQQWFRMLYSVQGVGPKAAMAILSVCPPEKLGFAIASDDKNAVRQADGVGPKLATRIITELKDKVAKMDLSATKQSATVAVAEQVGDVVEGGVDHDAVSALVNLGYGRSDAYAAVIQACKKSNDNSDLNNIIKLALKELAS